MTDGVFYVIFEAVNSFKLSRFGILRMPLSYKSPLFAQY
jgi:hypothetical protein